MGIVPAAGRAHRLGSPAASKELLPVYPDPDVPGQPLPVCYRLLHAFREADIPEALVVVRADKVDLRRRLEDDPPAGLRIRIVPLSRSPASAYTVAAGTREAGDAIVALGFPDVLWEGRRAFARLLEALLRGADAVLGLFPQAPSYPTHGVEVDGLGRVEALHGPGAGRPGRHPAWTLAVWRPTMSRWLEAAVDARYELGASSPSGDLELGMTEIFRSALDDGLRLDAIEISWRPFLDVGDPARLAEARRRAELPPP